ncbi:MAG: class I mannose-6-phosphate isomerase [Chlamydiales bacterium]|nr:class I mannose-6-phosphate isomerase [Chlamydiales bacterium]
MKIYPICFQPFYKDSIWGGTSISTVFGRKIPFGRCAESWELSDRSEGMCYIANGCYKGHSLKELMQQFPQELVGANFNDNHFPLLIKMVDANQHLSIQVHPDKKAAKLLGGEAKTEMLLVLASQPDGIVYMGLHEEIGKKEMLQLIANNQVQNYLKKIKVNTGDVLVVPAGHIHAVGSGVLLYEVQQNSNTTYRIYDWGRKEIDGNARELHINEAMQAIHFHEKVSYLKHPVIEYQGKDGLIETLVDSSHFIVKRVTAQSTFISEKTNDSFHFLFVIEGSIRIIIDNELVHLKDGESCLIPAACSEFVAQPLTETTFLQTSFK